METLKGFLILFGFIFLVVYKIKSDNIRNLQTIEILKKSILKKSNSVILLHLEQLARQKKKSTFNDDYGKENLSNWYNREIPYFYESFIFPKLNESEKLNAYLFYNEIISEIDKKVKLVKLKAIEYDVKMTGFEFEDFCVSILEKSGWKVDKTKSGADQGVDLIISKNHRKIGVQCKKYSKPIGNKSVQEIKAGLLHYNLNEGIVLSNNKFTKSAIELSNSNNIALIHFLEIDKI